MKRESVLSINAVLALVLLGVLMVYSVATVRGYSAADMEGHTYRYLLSHVLRVGIGLLGLFVAARLDYHIYTKRTILYPMIACTVFLLVLVLVLAEARHGAKRWLTIAGFSIQPSDLARLVAIIVLAVKLSEKQDRIRRFWAGFVPVLVWPFLFAVLIALERDIGAPVLIGFVALIMALMAGARWAHLLFSVGAASSLVGSYVWWHPHAQERLYAYRDPLKYRLAEGYQLIQSLWAFARGSVTGQGPGAGQQKLGYVPEAHSDFIFAALGEELGLVGTIAVVLLFVVFLVAAMRIAVCAPDLLGGLLAAGVTCMITLQAILHMAVTTGLAPTKGLALPFISAGGTALMLNLTMVGILVNVGCQAVESDRLVRLAPPSPRSLPVR